MSENEGAKSAIESVYLHAKIQLCIVHMIINSVKYISYQDWKELCQDLKLVYSAVSEKQELKALGEFKKNGIQSIQQFTNLGANIRKIYPLFLNILMIW